MNFFIHSNASVRHHCSNDVGKRQLSRTRRITKKICLAAYQVALLPNLVVKQDVFHVPILGFTYLICIVNLFCLMLSHYSYH